MTALILCWSALQIFTGWVITILFACGICALLVALGVNSPNRQSIDQIIDAQEVGLPLTGVFAADQGADLLNCDWQAASSVLLLLLSALAATWVCSSQPTCLLSCAA